MVVIMMMLLLLMMLMMLMLMMLMMWLQCCSASESDGNQTEAAETERDHQARRQGDARAEKLQPHHQPAVGQRVAS